MNAVDISLEIVKELETTLKQVNPDQTEALVQAILKANRVYVAGAGRSLLMIRGLAMRLMHLGFTAYVVGETVTPAIEVGDLLIIGSGSGETGTLQVMAAKAKKVGASLALITVHPESTIGKLANFIVKIPATTPKTSGPSTAQTIQPGANLFEQSLLLVGDALIIRILEVKHIADGNTDLMKRHANLE